LAESFFSCCIILCMKKTKASNFDKMFDDGESIIEHLDISEARRPAEEQKRINMDIPAWMLAALDREAKRLGVTRQSIIKIWLAERLQAGQ
jgi:dsDNA-binding SOS-regulon protein